MSKISERGELAGDIVGEERGERKTSRRYNRRYRESATSRNDIIIEERIEIVVDIGEKSASA